MNIGDRVTLREFQILELKEEQYICQFETDDEVVYYAIPIYCNAFGIRFKTNDYVLPGGSVDRDHPDYLKFIYNEISTTKRAIYEMPNSFTKVYLDLDPEFTYNGIYYLYPLDGSESIRCQAGFKSDRQRKSTLNAWIGTEVDEKTVTAYIIRMYIKEYTRNDKHVEFTDIVYIDNTEEAKYFYSADESEIFVVLHDEGGDIEYTVPLSLIKLL